MVGPNNQEEECTLPDHQAGTIVTIILIPSHSPAHARAAIPRRKEKNGGREADNRNQGATVPFLL